MLISIYIYIYIHVKELAASRLTKNAKLGRFLFESGSSKTKGDMSEKTLAIEMYPH